jgi:hypothetical protein
LPKKETAALRSTTSGRTHGRPSDNPKNENGTKGIGLLVIRYYDPR